MLRGIGVSPRVSCGRVHVLISDTLNREEEQAQTAGEAKEEMAAFVKKAVGQLSCRQAEELAAEVLRLTTAAEVRTALEGDY